MHKLLKEYEAGTNEIHFHTEGGATFARCQNEASCPLLWCHVNKTWRTKWNPVHGIENYPTYRQ